jgi:hypothetical protein
MPAVVPAAAERPGLLPGLGVLTSVITPELVDEVVDLAGCREERRRMLPARVMVYFVLGMCLLSGEDGMAPPGYRSVMRSLSHGVRHLAGLALPSAAALCRRRRMLGVKVLAFLLERLAGPLAVAGDAGAFAFGLRVLAWDSTVIDVPDSPANEAAFGRHKAGNGDASRPQVRLLALAECGTHGLIDAVFDGFATTSELALAPRLLAALRPGMLLLADRNFRGHELWAAAAATGAELCWRATARLGLDPLEVLGDGSWTSLLLAPGQAHRSRRELARRRTAPQGTRVRVIEYHVTVATRDGRHRRTERFRLVTTILDPSRAPAAELAALYHRRWEIEGGFLELKARLKGSGLALRSRDPEMAAQEMLAFLCVQQALAIMEHRAAAQAGTGTGRLSFTATIRIARDHARTQAALLAPGGLAAATAQATADMLSSLLPPRRHRQSPREQKPRPVRYPRGTDATRTHGPITCSIQIKPPAANTGD